MMQAYAEYKDSGVDWLGEIPEGWELTKLGSCLSPFSEKNHADLPLLSITRELGVIQRDVENQDTNHNYIPDDLSGYKLLKKGQFGMNKMKAWQGSYGVSPFTGIVSPAYFMFDFTKEIYPDFFHVAIRSKLYVSFFGSASDGVRIGQWDLSKPRMKEIPLALPPLPEQTAIADFLDDKTAKIDELVGIKRRQIALLGERKQILIQNAVTKGLNPNAPLKDSGIDWIGKIPAHWEVKQIKHFATIRSGDGITNSALHDNGEYEVFGGNGLMGYSNRYNTSGEYFVIGRVGAYCGNVRLANTKKWISDNALVLRLISVIKSEFLLHVLDAADLNKMNESNAQPLITGTKVMNLQFPFPPDSEQEDVAHFIISSSKKIDSAISIKQNQITKLNEYKTTLINAAVTGNIKVA